MTQCTENYECLVLDNTSRSNKIEDTVFWYKAKERKEFKMGSPALWDHHKRNYNPKHDSPPDLDAGSLKKKKNVPQVVVVKTDAEGKKKKKKKVLTK